eukprot:3446026-Amphidinium_carterae.1
MFRRLLRSSRKQESTETIVPVADVILWAVDMDGDSLPLACFHHLAAHGLDFSSPDFAFCKRGRTFHSERYHDQARAMRQLYREEHHL